jgi:hypothetical protein
MKIIKLLFLLSIFISLSCSDDITTENEGLIKPVIFISDNINSLQSDSVIIEQIEIKNNILTISCSYLGGCEVHSLNLFSEIGFLESDPVQLRMRLIHHAYSDSCQNVINEKVAFDLKSVATLYKSAYRTNKGIILFSVYDSDVIHQYVPQPRYEF